MNLNKNFWNNKRVFITGHSGFKGSWLSFWLSNLGAKVKGYALKPNTAPNLFNILKIDSKIESTFGDIVDYENLRKNLLEFKPEIIFHMAAQPLVRYSYLNPIETYKTNVIGTANILNILRELDSVKAFLNVTTDKCYENLEWIWPYRETDRLGGHDPYSNSKACSELVTSAFYNSYFKDKTSLGVATARAGNVIGGGDWSLDRLIPDFIRSVSKNETITIRNPNAIRPWQHVLDPLSGYILLAEKLYDEREYFSEAWNFAPSGDKFFTVEMIINKICNAWGANSKYQIKEDNNLHEAGLLSLDPSKAIFKLKWKPKLDVNDSVEKTINWYKNYYENNNMEKFTIEQIESYLRK